MASAGVQNSSASTIETRAPARTLTFMLQADAPRQRWGPTPLRHVRLAADGPAIWCKCEFQNPSGSIKDRIAEFILDKALRRGDLRSGGLVCEASSGSTSIALAMACAQRDLQFIAVMPETVSPEHIKLIKAFGAAIELTPSGGGITACLERCEAIGRERGAFLPCQFSNIDNANAHRYGTAWEIIGQLPDNHVDAIVSGVGTGGTLVGLYQGLCDHGCQPTAVLAIPTTGTCMGGIECTSFSSNIPGVVDGISRIFAESDCGTVRNEQIEDHDALAVTRRLLRAGFPVGPSSGLNYLAAWRVARELGEDAVVVTVFPDRVERYFSGELFANDDLGDPFA